MIEVDVVYEGELHCLAKHGPSGATVATDAPTDNHGRGESFSPTDLVATALATCMATTMGLVAQRHGIDLAGLRVSVEKEMTAVPSRRIGRLPVAIQLPRDPGPEASRLLEAAALGCPVHVSLHPDVQRPVTFQWGARAAAARTH